MGSTKVLSKEINNYMGALTKTQQQKRLGIKPTEQIILLSASE